MKMCDELAVRSLLEDDRDIDTHYPDIARHVESCSNCQNRLSQLAADDEQWDEMRQLLSSCDGSDSRYTESLTARERWKSPVAWSDEMAKSLLSAASHPEMLGRIGRYDVERLIGSGGMGVVFKAYDTELNRPVAVKLLAPYLASNGAARSRFAREARAAAAVVDEHVVPIHNVETDAEAPFLVMKYIAGGSLQMRLDRDGPMDVCEVLRVGIHTAKGLAAAHAQGIVHRDVKPSNILLDEGVERALLTDFGLARVEDDASLTRSGFHPGTPHYMSPEQVRGEAIDARSDLFGLGCVLYSLCTGHPPFRSETSYAVLRRVTDDAPRPIRETNPTIPSWLEQIVMKLLAKLPGDRFDSAEEVAGLLEDCLAHAQQPTSTPLPETARALAPRQNRRPPIGRIVAAAAFGCSLIFAGVLITLELNKGTLTVESDADDVPIRIMQGDELVKRMTVTTSGTSIRVAAGKYVVEVEKPFDHPVIKGGTVTVKRGKSELVKISSASNEAQTGTDSIIKRFDGLPIETEVHVVGCYRAKNNNPVNVRIERTGNPMVVVLNAYNATSWNLDIADSADVRGIIVSGYFDQRFSHLAPNDVPIRFLTYWPIWKGITAEEKKVRHDHCFYVCSPLMEDFKKMTSLIREITDREVATFQGIYEAESFVIDGIRGTEERKIAQRWRGLLQRSDQSARLFRRASAELESMQWDTEPDRKEVLRRISQRMNVYERDLNDKAGLGVVAPDVRGDNSEGETPIVEAIAQYKHQMSAEQIALEQPMPTEQELVAFALWKIRTGKQLTPVTRSGLTKIAIQRRLPKDWTIRSWVAVPKAKESKIRMFQLVLVDNRRSTIQIVRTRYLRTDRKPLTDGDVEPSPAAMPLTAKINEFNAIHNTIDGIRQPPLTVDEVVAAILHWGSRRDEAAVDNATFQAFLDLANTLEFPSGVEFEVIPRFQTVEGDEFKIWSIRIKMLQAAKPDWTYSFLVREHFVSVDAVTSAEEKASPTIAPNETSQLLSQIDLLNRLEDRGPNSKRSIRWGAKLIQLTRLGSEAVPHIIAELDRTDDDRMIACLSFVLRAIGDKRGVPALIRAIPRIGVPISDSNWIDGDRDVHNNMHAFFRQHKFKGQGDASLGGCSNSITELRHALESLTGANLPIARTFGTGTPRQIYLQQELLYRNATDWTEWWKKNSSGMVDDISFTKVTVPAIQGRLPDAVQPNQLLTKIHRRSGYQLQTLHDSTKPIDEDRPAFLDLDTGRCEPIPQQWRGKQLSESDTTELLTWAESEGFDLACDQYQIEGDHPHYLLRGLGLKTWHIDDQFWEDNLVYASWGEIAKAGKKSIDDWLIPFDRDTGALDPSATAPFLFLTQEGSPGIVYMGVIVNDDSERLESAVPLHYDEDPVGFVNGRKLTVQLFEPATTNIEATQATTELRTNLESSKVGED